HYGSAASRETTRSCALAHVGRAIGGGPRRIRPAVEWRAARADNDPNRQPGRAYPARASDDLLLAQLDPRRGPGAGAGAVPGAVLARVLVRCAGRLGRGGARAGTPLAGRGAGRVGAFHGP